VNRGRVGVADAVVRGETTIAVAGRDSTVNPVGACRPHSASEERPHAGNESLPESVR
jgi:hypothetical protein